MSAQDTYSIIYRTDVAVAVANMEKLKTAARETFKSLEDLETLMKRLGRDTTQLAAFVGVMNSLGRSVGDVVDRAAKANAETGKIGADTSRVDALTKEVQQLSAALAKAEADAKRAKAETDKLGKGGGAPSVPTTPGAPGAGGAGRAGVVAFAASILKANKDALSSAEKAGLESAAKAEEMRAAVQPLVPLTGRTTADDSLMAEQLKLAEAAGLSPEKAAKFSEVFLGATGAGTARFKATGGKQGISEETAAKLLPHAAAFAQRTGIEPEVAGKMIGSIGTFVPIKDEQQAMNMFGQIEGHLNLGGLGTIRELSRPFQSLMGEFAGPGGRIGDPVRVAATFAATSNVAKSAATAATSLKQANRGLRKLTEAGKFGLTTDMDYNEGIAKLRESLAGMDDAAATRSIYAAGVHESTEVASMIQQTKLLPMVEQYMQDQRVKAMGANAINANRTYLGSQAGRTATAKAALEAAEIRRGMGFETYVGELTGAEARLIDRGEIDTTATNMSDWLTDSFQGGLLTGVRNARFGRVETEVTRGLMNRAEAAGMNPAGFYGRYGAGLESGDFATRAGTAARAVKELETLEKQRQNNEAFGKVIDKLDRVIDGVPGVGAKDSVFPKRS